MAMDWSTLLSTLLWNTINTRAHKISDTEEFYRKINYLGADYNMQHTLRELLIHKSITHHVLVTDLLYPTHAHTTCSLTGRGGNAWGRAVERYPRARPANSRP